MQGLLGVTLSLLAACSLAAVATAAFRVPALLGYLAAGALLGPSVTGVIAPGEALDFLSELGVALLLFMVALEFSLGHFLAHSQDRTGGWQFADGRCGRTSDPDADGVGTASSERCVAQHCGGHVFHGAGQPAVGRPG